jgi:hypothetical protein
VLARRGWLGGYLGCHHHAYYLVAGRQRLTAQFHSQQVQAGLLIDQMVIFYPCIIAIIKLTLTVFKGGSITIKAPYLRYASDMGHLEGVLSWSNWYRRWGRTEGRSHGERRREKKREKKREEKDQCASVKAFLSFCDILVWNSMLLIKLDHV